MKRIEEAARLREKLNRAKHKEQSSTYDSVIAGVFFAVVFFGMPCAMTITGA